MAKPELYDVAIVGLGPTGATLANLLGLCGLSVLVLERESGIYGLPRAVHFDDEVMRVFQTIGVAEEVEISTRVNVGMRFVDPDGKLLLDWPRPADVTPQGWHASYRFHQPDLETVLRKALDRYPQVEVRTGTDVRIVEDRGTHVDLVFEATGSSIQETASARYVVGCDGARSLVRRTMGCGMDDLGFNERWLVVDVILKKDKPELGNHSIQFCDPHRPATYCRSPGMRRRWEITVRDDEDSEDIATSQSVWHLLSRWLTPEEADIERRAVYTFHSTLARKWRDGRLLIAGDAAHQTPPFMGQGMCTGIRDAANLAWKLADTIRAKTDADLLESYQQERMPHARTYIETAIRLGGLINTLGTGEALDAAFSQSDGAARMESIAPRLGPGLATFSNGPVGRPAVQPRLSDGQLMDDAIGYGPVLLVRDSLLEEVNDWPIPLLTANTEPAVAVCLEELQTGAVLVRPDRYVLGLAGSTKEMKELQSRAKYLFSVNSGRVSPSAQRAPAP
ncbi:MAG: bifunctional 3-(3-hydroxy-phenyl)propionate/3-hydroxycinnamic acid hydroxylase [Pseudomonadota bacterium]